MKYEQICCAINAFYEDKMRKCEISNEEKYRIYEMFLEWYPENTTIPDDMDESGIDDLIEELWEDFCDVHNVDSKSVHFGSPYPSDLEPDEREDYDEAFGDMMTKDW